MSKYSHGRISTIDYTMGKTCQFSFECFLFLHLFLFSLGIFSLCLFFFPLNQLAKIYLSKTNLYAIETCTLMSFMLCCIDIATVCTAYNMSVKVDDCAWTICFEYLHSQINNTGANSLSNFVHPKHYK